MFRFLAAPVACLALAGPAAAQGARYVSLPPETVPVPRDGAAAASKPGAGVETTAALKAQAAAVQPWCPAERRVGTGAGFCLVN